MAVGGRTRTANSSKLLVMLLGNSRRIIIKTAMVQLSCRCGQARQRVLPPKDAAVSDACGTGKDSSFIL
jgi:hypothetical protein